MRSTTLLRIGSFCLAIAMAMAALWLCFERHTVLAASTPFTGISFKGLPATPRESTGSGAGTRFNMLDQ